MKRYRVMDTMTFSHGLVTTVPADTGRPMHKQPSGYDLDLLHPEPLQAGNTGNDSMEATDETRSRQCRSGTRTAPCYGL